MSVTDYADYQTPAAHATAISVTGAPLLNLHNLLQSQSAKSLGAASSVTLPTISFNQPGWEFELQLNIGAAATVPWVRLQFQWQDATGEIVWYDEWYLAAGSGTAAFANYYMGQGIAKGNQLIITLGNPDPALILGYTLNVYQTSQFTPRSYIQTQNISNPFSCPGHAVPDVVDPSNLILATRKASLAASGGSDVTLLPAYSGKVRIFAESTSNTNDMTMTISVIGNNALNISAAFIILYRNKTDANGNLNAEFSLPRAPVQIQMNNNNAAIQTCEYFIVMEEY